MDNKKKIANVFLDKGEKIEGFKILWFIPFFLSHIGMPTMINICSYRNDLQKIKGSDKADLNDFYDAELLKNSYPIIVKLILTALMNDKWYNYILYPFLYLKVRQCDNRQILGLYTKIVELSDPSFFLAYYKHMIQKDHTILKED